MNTPILLSVVVCTYNRCDLLKGALESLQNQSVAPEDFEVLIIDNASTDDTKAVSTSYVSRNQNFRYFYETKKGASSARNRGCQEARGLFVAFIDDDGRADEFWIQVYLKLIQTLNPRPLILGGPIYPFYLGRKPDWFLDKYEIRNLGVKGYIDLDTMVNISGSNMVLELMLIRQLGGFDPALGPHGEKFMLGEETELLERVAHISNQDIVAYYEPDAIVYHAVPPEKYTVAYRLHRAYIGSKNLAQRTKGQDPWKQKLGHHAWYSREIVKAGWRFLLERKNYSHAENWWVESFVSVVRDAGTIVGIFSRI